MGSTRRASPTARVKRTKCSALSAAPHCRLDEYVEAVNELDVLTGAAVIRLSDLSIDDVAQYADARTSTRKGIREPSDDQVGPCAEGRALRRQHTTC